MKIGLDGWLTGATRVQSARASMLDVPSPFGLVWHWTGGKGGHPKFGMNLAESIRSYVKGADTPASWHILVAKDGSLIQSVPFNMGSWHCGRPGRIGKRLFGNINRGTVGVELENAGHLQHAEGKFYCWPYWSAPTQPGEKRFPDRRYEVDASRAVEHKGKWFDGFPAAQEEAAGVLLKALVEKYRWGRDVCVYGHRDFDPRRREDPGDLWCDVLLPRVLERVFTTG